MRVAIDARELCGRPTGVGRYLAGLLDAWSSADAVRRHSWTLIAPREIPEAHRWPVAVTIAPGAGGTTWEQTVLASAVRAAGADVFFAPGYTAPLTVAAPLVLTIHDVSFFAHPEWFSFREGMRRRTLTAWSARRARRVITDTTFSKSEIEKHIGIPAGRISAIPLGVEPPGDGSLRDDSPRDASEAMVLFVGSIFERRRVDRLIKSFDAVAAKVPNAHLQIVGENRTRRPRLDLDALRSASSHPAQIHIRSYVDAATLSDLYHRASVFAFLSEYEGFGFTPLEALSAGVPPVLLDTAVARETCGHAARYVSAEAGNDHIADAIVDLLANAGARREVLRHADEVLARYDWRRTAERTLTVLEEAAVGR
jgi:glycosyltransferase involved in cell wall biosynthesis